MTVMVRCGGGGVVVVARGLRCLRARVAPRCAEGRLMDNACGEIRCRSSSSTTGGTTGGGASAGDASGHQIQRSRHDGTHSTGCLCQRQKPHNNDLAGWFRFGNRSRSNNSVDHSHTATSNSALLPGARPLTCVQGGSVMPSGSATRAYTSAATSSATMMPSSGFSEDERDEMRRILAMDLPRDAEERAQSAVKKHSMLGKMQRATRDLDVAAAAVLQQKAMALADQGTLLPESFFHSLVYIYAEAGMALKAFKAYELTLSLGFHPRENILSKLASTSAAHSDTQLAREVIDTMHRFNITPHYRTYWKLIEVMAGHDVKAASAVLARVMEDLGMPYPSHSAYDSMNDVFAIVVRRTAEQLHGGEHVQVVSDLFAHFQHSNQPLGKSLFTAVRAALGGREEWDVAPADIEQHSGRCAACGDTLRPIALSESDLASLGSAISVYLQQEGIADRDIEGLRRIVDEQGDVEIFVDGLNVGHFGVRSFRLDLVLQTAQLLKSAGYSFLIVLRSHAVRRTTPQQKKKIDALVREGRLALLRNTLSDDIGFISAAVQLRPNSYVLTNDFFRDHMFRVSKIPGGHLFDRWRRGHCIHYEYDFTTKRRGAPKMRLFWPPKHDNVAQPTATAWHLPCEDGTWLCCAFADEIVG